jgi:hypothetical protein
MGGSWNMPHWQHPADASRAQGIGMKRMRPSLLFGFLTADLLYTRAILVELEHVDTCKRRYAGCKGT